MKKTIAALAAILAVGSLAACSDNQPKVQDSISTVSGSSYDSFGPADNPDPADDSSLDSRVLSDAAIDNLYINMMRDYGLPEYYSDSELVQAAHRVCGKYNEGNTGSTIIALTVGGILQLPGDTAEQMGYIMGAAVPAYCPEFNDLVDQ